MVKHAAPKQRRHPAGKLHPHDSERCLGILRQLSDFIDDELPGDICLQIRRHLGDCPHCEEFVASLRQTVSLCRQNLAPALSADERALMREKILNTTRSR